MKRIACMLFVLALLASCVPAFAQEVVEDDVLDEEAVKTLQIDLIAGGYLDGEADGLMGNATQEAIRKAEEDLGMPVTGAVSDELSAALLKDAFPMQEGSRSSMVYKVQQPLYVWGFMESAPTGYYGEKTVEAVEAFQEFAIDQYSAILQSESDAVYAAMEVPTDVIVDQPLYNESTVPCDGVMTQDWYDFMTQEFEFPHTVVSLDDKGENVRMVQRRLHSLGYLYSGMDGAFGSGTELALKYFQKRNSLPETGICDLATSNALFNEEAVESDEYVMPYAAYVKRSKSRVYIYGWDGSGYNTPVKAFKCSCGARKTPTIEGTFYCIGPISEWYYMQSSNIWVRYAFQIQGNYFFHSVLFKHKGDTKPTASVYDLGRNVSHGCIRLAVEDVKWIYMNCTEGMKVVID